MELNMSPMTPQIDGSCCIAFGEGGCRYMMKAVPVPGKPRAFTFMLRKEGGTEKPVPDTEFTADAGESMAGLFYHKAFPTARIKIAELIADPKAGPDEKAALKRLSAQIGAIQAQLSFKIWGREPIVMRFTFGSDPAYDYGRGQYVEVYGASRRDCAEAFRLHHPDREDGTVTLNCASCYAPEEWRDIKPRHYADKEPVQTIVSESLYGRRPSGFSPVWAYVPKEHALLFLSVSQTEDACIIYKSWRLDNRYRCPMDGDASRIRTENPLHERFPCLIDALPAALHQVFGDSLLEAVMLDM